MQTSPRLWIRWHTRHGENVPETCRHFRISRATLYRWRARYRQDPHAPLRRQSRRPKSPRAPGWTVGHLLAVAQVAHAHPAWGRVRVWQALSPPDQDELSAVTVGRLLRLLRTNCPFCCVLRPNYHWILTTEGSLLCVPPRSSTGHSKQGCSWLVNWGLLAPEVLEQRLSPSALRRYVKQLVEGPGRAQKAALAQQAQRMSQAQMYAQFEKIMTDEETRELLAEAMRLIEKRSGNSEADD